MPSITNKQKEKIIKVLNVFESGTPDGKYDELVVYSDGENGSKQITYGRSQTTEQGNLVKLIKMYINNGGIFANGFSPYLPKIGNIPLWDDDVFKSLLKKAAREDKIMQDTQDDFFDKIYYQPAYKFFEVNGFTQALSLLVIYDSYIHSGGILMFLRKRFSEVSPVKGGDEKKWISSYTDVRNQWLKYHSNHILRKTTYRTKCFMEQIANGNWDLSKSINANGTVVS